MLYCLVLSVIVVLFLFVLGVITYFAFEKSGWFSLLYISLTLPFYLNSYFIVLGRSVPMGKEMCATCYDVFQ